MKILLKKNLTVIVYFLICSFLIVKAEIDCLGVNPRGWGTYFCSEMEHIFLKWLLMPTIFWMDLLNYSAIHNYLYEITVHAKFYLIVITFFLNTLVVFLLVKIIHKTLKKRKCQK